MGIGDPRVAECGAGACCGGGVVFCAIVTFHIKLFYSSQLAFRIAVLMAFDVPERDGDPRAALDGVANCSVDIVIIVGGVVWTERCAVEHGVNVRYNSLVITETLEPCASVGGGVILCEVVHDKD